MGMIERIRNYCPLLMKPKEWELPPSIKVTRKPVGLREFG
jgi:hypothetical protein